MAVTGSPSDSLQTQKAGDRHALVPAVLPPPAREPVGHFMRELFLGGVLWGLLLLALATIPVVITIAVTDAWP